MRVALVNLQRDFGGAERHVLDLAAGLRARGVDATLVCHPEGRLLTEGAAAEVPTARVGARTQLDPGAFVRLARCFRRLRPHVVHLQTPKDYVTGSLAARAAGVRAVVITRHMLLPVKPLMRRVYARADAVVCLTQALRDSLAAQGVPSGRLELIYGAIDTRRYDLPPDAPSVRAARDALCLRPGEVALGCVGRLVRGKGHEALLRAVRLALDHCAPIRLVIAGEGPERAALQTLQDELSLAANTAMVGFHADVAPLLCALDVVALPSTIAELLPLSLLEALAAGRAVVASRAGGVTEVLRDGVNGLMVTPGSVEELAGAIERLAASASLRRQLGSAARADVADRFDMARMVDETARLYERLQPGT